MPPTPRRCWEISENSSNLITQVKERREGRGSKGRGSEGRGRKGSREGREFPKKFEPFLSYLLYNTGQKYSSVARYQSTTSWILIIFLAHCLVSSTVWRTYYRGFPCMWWTSDKPENENNTWIENSWLKAKILSFNLVYNTVFIKQF